MLETLGRLFAHVRWADARLLEALEGATPAPADAWHEYAHILGADETWLARLEGRSPALPVWPELSTAEVQARTGALHRSYAGFLDVLSEPRLGEVVAYTTSDGRRFSSTIGDILLHVALHAQYHRGKVSLLLRQAERAPAPVDFIAFARGVPAARRPPSTGSS